MSTEPMYLRIVDEIRGRIVSGELRPGDRVPSARQIARDQGVAIATATKVLATLQAEGLTTTRTGIGTVVAATTRTPPARRRRDGDTDLSRERIVAAAIAIADADGMAEVSMRRIAIDLGVATMSLYRHVSGKDDLLLFMIDAALGEERFPTTRPDGWRSRLELAARLQWRLFRAHPWLAPAMSITRPQLAPNALAHTDWVLSAFDDDPVTFTDRMFVHVMLFSYVRGVATALEPEAEAERDTGLTNDEWMQAQQETLAAFAGTNALGTFLGQVGDFDFDLDLLFEFGLARILDGVQVFHDAAAPSPPAEDRPIGSHRNLSKRS